MPRPPARIAVALAVLAVAVLAARAGTARPSGPPPGTFAGCPHRVRPLPTSLAGLPRAVIAFVHSRFLRIEPHHGDVTGARVVTVFRVSKWLPSGWIKSECGLNVWRRSAGVDVYFPKLDKPHNPVGHCNACASLVFIASLTSGGWTIWGDY